MRGRRAGETSGTTLCIKRRMTLPTPMQNSYTSSVRDRGRNEQEGRGWNARERTIIAENNTSFSVKFSARVFNKVK